MNMKMYRKSQNRFFTFSLVDVRYVCVYGILYIHINIYAEIDLFTSLAKPRN